VWIICRLSQVSSVFNYERFTNLLLLNMVLSQIGVVTEMEISQWLVDSIAPALKDWFARGAFYLFFAVIATEESTIDTDDSKIVDGGLLTEVRFTALLLDIAAGGLICSGLLYLVMSLFCLKELKERSERENDERLTRMMNAQRRRCHS
jgi:uncharacterized membrane protein (DUF441 family)